MKPKGGGERMDEFKQGSNKQQVIFGLSLVLNVVLVLTLIWIMGVR